MSTKEKIVVMQAFVEGKTVEFCSKTGNVWRATPTPAWNWHDNEYRVKPEPMKFYIVVDAEGNPCPLPYLNRHTAVEVASRSRSGWRVIAVREVPEDDRLK